jgi:Basic region leucine zipper
LWALLSLWALPLPKHAIGRDFRRQTHFWRLNLFASGCLSSCLSLLANVLRLQGEYQFSEFAEFHNILGDGAAGVVPILDQTSRAFSPSVTTSPPSGFISSGSGGKRKADSIVDSNHAHSLEGASRIAAEEDKRRRNTAASARFRVKKKQREQALERTAKEMTDKCSRLEARIGQLEMENKWLKNLITEKNENKDDIAELWRKFNRDSNSEQKASDRLDSCDATKAEAN